MNVLLIGSGGREHAIAWSLAKSPRLARLFVAPGNAGIASIAEQADIDVSNHSAVIAFCKENAVDYVVVGPEAPLVAGIVDALSAAGIKAFGPSLQAARLEGSKAFTKEMCTRAGVPTAAYGQFSDPQSAKDYIKKMGAPIVVKADGLAAGKGVVVAQTLDEALAAVDMCFAGTFGDAGAEVVIEECLIGEEASFFVLSDGENILPLLTAQDHKRAHDGDTGPNTGGMGAYSPAPVLTDQLVAQTLEEIIRPTVADMKKQGHPFRGVLYAGLMITELGPKLIEYNVRFGDPECQVILMLLKSDLLPLLLATTEGTLDQHNAQWHDDVALSVVMASNGYPGSYQKGTPINGLDAAASDDKVEIFHAGTTQDASTLRASGGRVLNVTARGKSVQDARQRAYSAVEKVVWPGGFCRSDIGWREIERESRE